ncbi:MAG: sulfur carrier protein ThiS [Bacteroidetes bacterium]|uniref:Sulfur carrier protein ThiS n=1 Tax=Candidatus Enterocola intestinipullorum TaxID=2840783 RepID=A0A9D9EK35_9BACT|nr:sulfur carrier protein ThiS [Candidatus Enterocola intestinipullorum]
MKISVNNKETVTEARNIADLAVELELPSDGIAIAVDNKMVKRSEWENTTLEENAKVLIIKAACGG